MKFRKIYKEAVDDMAKGMGGAMLYISKNSPYKEEATSFAKEVVGLFSGQMQEANFAKLEAKQQDKKNKKGTETEERPEQELTPPQDDAQASGSEQQNDTQLQNEPEEQDVQNAEKETDSEAPQEKTGTKEPEHFIGPSERKMSTTPENKQGGGTGRLHMEYVIGNDEKNELKGCVVVRILERDKETKSATGKYLMHVVFPVADEKAFIEDLKHNRWQLGQILKKNFGV